MQIHEGESKFAKLNKLERDCESATEIRSSGCKDEQISKTTTNLDDFSKPSWIMMRMARNLLRWLRQEFAVLSWGSI
jgi:hypothetical protein